MQMRPSLTQSVARLAVLSLGGSAFALSAGSARAATILPVSLSFNQTATPFDYDKNFVEAATNNGITQTSQRLQINAASAVFGTAVFDTSATNPGNNGTGGTSGTQANNDLSNVTLSSLIRASSVNASQQAGYFFRLDNTDANGYLATASYASTSGFEFRVYQGVGLTTATLPTPIFDATPTSNGSVANSTDYQFKVTAQDGPGPTDLTFGFQLLNSAGTVTQQSTSFTTSNRIGSDPGQVGVYLAIPANGTSVIDNFGIAAALPEPAAVGCLALASLGLLARRRGRR